MRSIEDLVPQLTKLTQDDKLIWEGDVGPEMFIASLPRNFIRIAFQEEDDIEIIGVQLLDRGRKVIDVARADQFSPRYDVFLSLFHAARRSAHNVNEVISEIEKDIFSL